MGICEFPTIKRRYSVKIEECKETVNSILFPKGEQFYTKTSYYTTLNINDKNIDDILWDKIQLLITSNNKSGNSNSVFKFKFEISNQNDGSYRELGETDSLSGKGLIKFNTMIMINYTFHQEQIIKVTAYQDLVTIFSVTFTIGSLMGSKSNNLIIPIKNKSNELIGEIGIDGNHTTKMKVMTTFDIEFTLTFPINASQQDNNKKDYLFFYVISNCIKENEPKYLYKSNEFSLTEKKNTYKNTFHVSSDKLCLCDNTKYIKIEIFEIKDIKEIQHTLTDSVFSETIQLSQLESSKDGVTIPLKPNPNIQISSQVKIKYSQREMFSFLEYIKSGMQMNLITGIDFTTKNLPYDNPSSLHYLSSSPNLYEKAITVFGNLISYYDYDHLFPLYGMGGKKEASQEINYCFPLSPDIKLNGVKSLINTYKESIKKVIQGDTLNLSAIINEALTNIKAEIDEGINKYYIILLLVSGQCEDIKEMKDVLVKASEYPVSIFIVGLGNDKYEDIALINNEEYAIINSNGDKIKRDIIQFIPIEKTKGDINEIVKEMLNEIPRQVEEYYEMEKNIKFSLLSN